MGKIAEFEQRLIQQGMTDEDLAEYGKLLKRVHGNYQKQQHCYTTAIQFPPRNACQAIKLIRYGLENFEAEWFSTYQAYLYIGHIYELIGNYPEAFNAYLLARKALGNNRSYVADLSKELFWMKLHVDSFRYSAELEEYVSCYETADEFSKALVNNQFRLAVAHAVISLHYGKTEEAQQSLETAKKIIQPDYAGPLAPLLARHRYRETLKITREAKAFIRNF